MDASGDRTNISQAIGDYCNCFGPVSYFYGRMTFVCSMKMSFHTGCTSITINI